MALWDHVGDDEPNPAWPRRRPAEFAQFPSALPHFFRRAVDHPQSGNDNNHSPFADDPAYELDCLRRVLAPNLLLAAERRSRELGIGADQVLMSWGVIDDAAYLRRLALHLGVATEDFSYSGRADTPLSDLQIPLAAEFGLVPLRQDGRLIWTMAPRRLAARTLCQFAARYPSLKSSWRLTSADSLQQFLTRQGGEAMTHAATRGLADRSPDMSAAPSTDDRRRSWWHRSRRAAGVSMLLLLPAIFPSAAWDITLATWFLAFTGLRLTASLWPRRPLSDLPRLPDHRLPVYTIIAALYREATSVKPLMQAINALDYPREKLDVILVTELNDLQTRAAIARLGPMPHLRVLVAPAVAPKTKPKALNWALPFARGSFVAVFDAEDRPEPNQLRAALDAFRHYGDDVACAQASLCIDNDSHCLLSRMFLAEYAGQFDIFLPGMTKLGLPLPLGGTSNHFRASVLRQVGGWDAFNVTEDADLGFRLARLGYRSVTFASTTYEEAPMRFGAWRRQRTRWMKGWIQTWCVHMRHPWRAWRDMGTGGFLTLNLIAGGNVLTALTYPVLLAICGLSVISVLTSSAPQFSMDWPTPLHLGSIMAGYVSTIVVGLLGLAHRKQLRHAWILALTPLYWICLSIAAWFAVFQYVWNPYHWEKTEHGIAKRKPFNAPHRVTTPPTRRLVPQR